MNNYLAVSIKNPSPVPAHYFEQKALELSLKGTLEQTADLWEFHLEGSKSAIDEFVKILLNIHSYEELSVTIQKKKQQFNTLSTTIV